MSECVLVYFGLVSLKKKHVSKKQSLNHPKKSCGGLTHRTFLGAVVLAHPDRTLSWREKGKERVREKERKRERERERERLSGKECDREKGCQRHRETERERKKSRTSTQATASMVEKRGTEERDREEERTKNKTDRRGCKQVRARMTAMRHQVNVRANARESDRVKDKEREKESQRHLPTHSKSFAPTPKGICLHNARHLPPKFTHSKAFARQDLP